MNVLHIACGFSYSNVYKNLFAELDRQALNIEAYVPQHTDPEIQEINQKDYPYKIYSRKVIKSWDKYIYFSKILRMKKDIEMRFELSKVDVIHAHSLFSDGGVAYEIYKKYDIPYVVAVRDTDVNQYFKKAKHLKPYALKILKNAKAIVFLSQAYKESVIERFVPLSLQDKIYEKSVVIPNGISSFWLNNIYTNRPQIKLEKEEVNLIFVGQIIKRKNIESIIRASTEVSRKINKKVNLLIAGEKKDLEYYNYLASIGQFEYIGYCSSEELLNYYREADIFVMPSFTETFGLVYAEALSQGLPVIYTHGQGFDGQFQEGEVGYGVTATDISDISNKICDILNNYESISSNSVKKVVKFDWIKIGKAYKELYDKVINNKNLNVIKNEGVKI